MDEAETFVDFMLEDLELLLVYTPWAFINSLCEDLSFIRYFLKEAQRFTNLQIAADSSSASSSAQNVGNFVTCQMESLSQQEMSLLSKQVKSIEAIISRILKVKNLSKKTSFMELQVVEGVIGEKRALIDRLTAGPQRLEVVGISMMPGNLNALARELFMDPLINEYFEVCGSGCEYRHIGDKSILQNYFFQGNVYEFICQKGNWGNILRNSLEKRRYLIVLDAVESFGIWNDIKMVFPDDYNGSRVLLIRSHKDKGQKFWGHSKSMKSEDLWICRDIQISKGFSVPMILDALIYHLRTLAKMTKMKVDTEEDFHKRVANITRELFHSSNLRRLAAEVTCIKKEVLEIYNNGFSAMIANEVVSFTCENILRESSSPISGKGLKLGFRDEVITLRQRLTGNARKLEVIPIVGMAGIGKTTLAKVLYNDPPIVHHFHIRGWAFVSQAYQKSQFLDQILGFLVKGKESFLGMSDEGKEEILRKRLLGKRYLIIVDDIWDVRHWDDIKWCFPNNDNGSKILMTTRNQGLASDNRDISSPYVLRFRNKDESWDLFKHKVFADEAVPKELMEIGSKIVAKCKGLPLALVVVAGFLAKEEKNIGRWSRILESIGSGIENDAEQYMNILALSYEYLPHWLKPCFLYLGAFPEDFEIPVKRLRRYWIAEGFIQQTEVKRLEDVAEDVLMNLVDRNLVIVAKKRSDGGIKACHIHDMWRNFCIRRAQEIKFVLPNYGYESRASSSSFSTFFFNYFSSHGHSKLTCSNSNLVDFDLNFVPLNWLVHEQTMELIYNPLRVLNLGCVILDSFPDDILQLVRLKYFALQIETMKYLPPTICKLWNLETLIIDIAKGQRITLPWSIWKMVKLRHIDVTAELQFEMPQQNLAGPSTSREHEIEHHSANEPPLVLENLQTISQLIPVASVRHILAKTPNVRKLAFHFTLSESGIPFSFPELSSFNLLESLKFEYQTYGMVPVSIPQVDKFPPSLKKLTLMGCHGNWEQMSILGSLPNLEVLKLEDNFFSGPVWEAVKGGFLRLKYLKFSHMDLQKWIASSCSFLVLEKLVLNGCLDLEEIPSSFGFSYTLKVIEVYRSRPSVAESARKIQEFQRELNNDELEVFIYPQFQEDFLPDSAS